MDPNHWNTYNLQYGHTSSGGLPSTHASLTRLDLSSGSLGHSLQTSHGSLVGRTSASVPQVNYQTLSMPLLEPITAGFSSGQLVFEPQVRVSEQQSPSGRYDNPKSFRADGSVVRNQLLDVAAAARMLNSSTLSSNSLYNQFDSGLPDAPASSASNLSALTGVSINSLAVSKSLQPSMHEPPPAHSSSSARLSNVQRSPHHGAELLYARGSEALIPSSLNQFSSLYSSVALGKQNLGAVQQHSLHRQIIVPGQQGFSSSDIEDLSSNSQNQLYASYANISAAETQDFSSAHLSGEISYEAVSPAPSLTENPQNNPEPTTFSIVHFPELIHLTPENAHALADKFQENDFRLKIDTRPQQNQHETLAVSLNQPQRQESEASLKLHKDMANLLSMQLSQRGGQFLATQSVGHSISSQVPSTGVSNSQSSHVVPNSLNSIIISMQQPTTSISVQAPADSTTKPKRSRAKKKKNEMIVPPPGSQSIDVKKSSPLFPPNLHQQLPQVSQQSHTLTVPHTPQHNSTLTLSNPLTHNSNLQQQQQQQMQQQNFRNPTNNQFISRDVQKTQTPTTPQTYSVQNSPNQGYAPIQIPKMSQQNIIQSQNEFYILNNVPSDKSSTPSSLDQKQQQKSAQPAPKGSRAKNNQVFASNIPNSHHQQQHIQNFSSHSVLMGTSAQQQRGSPMQDSRPGSLGRMQSFDTSPQQINCQMSPLGQPSPQGSDSSGFGASKMSSSGHMMGTTGMVVSQSAASLPQSPLDSRPVERVIMTHSYEQSHTAALMESQAPGPYQLDFSGQPFLEQLVGAQPPLTLASSNFAQDATDNGEVVYTPLVTPSESARMQQHHQPSSDNFRPTYHGEPVHEIQPIGTLSGNLSMEEVSFNAFFDSQRELDQSNVSLTGSQQSAVPEPEAKSLTFIPYLCEDDDLGHFDQTPQALLPMHAVSKDTREGVSFQDSFLSYLQGHKQETLSSVSSTAPTKKPQLPKYIPEPRRPKPAPVAQQPKKSPHFSDVEESNQGLLGTKVKDLISSLSDNDNSSHKSESDREGYSVQRTSELAVKITLPKNKNKTAYGPFAAMTHLKDKSLYKEREEIGKKKRKRMKRHSAELEDFMPDETPDVEVPVRRKEQRQPSPVPVRTSIRREAKDKCLEKTKIHDSDSSSEEPMLPKGKSKTTYNSDNSDQNYDSDKDPVWMPFETDLKQGHEMDEKRRKIKRPRVHLPSIKSSKTVHSQKIETDSVLTSSNNLCSQSQVRPSTNPDVEGTGGLTSPNASTGDTSFKIGMYLMEKKDMQNYSNYCVWRLEPGNMLKKFELKQDSDRIVHQAVGVYSSWTPSMESQFVEVKVKELAAQVRGGQHPLSVEVLEQYRPKPPDISRLESDSYENSLDEFFNIYLQVFLSQALEPTFLSVILQTNEKFYVDALSRIDGLIEEKCKEIARLAHWKSSFQEYLHKCPLMKEFDRPNLKQACQASENSSPPTIKSVLLSGGPYDPFLLTAKPSNVADIAQEFMIGKVAAQYVRPYHSLCHFKLWLCQRCQAQVKMSGLNNIAFYMDGLNNIILYMHSLNNFDIGTDELNYVVMCMNDLNYAVICLNDLNYVVICLNDFNYVVISLNDFNYVVICLNDLNYAVIYMNDLFPLFACGS